MSLKKSDKMIAGIAVIVLIIAAVGIILYAEDKDGAPESDGDKDKLISYDVKCETMEGLSATPDNSDFKVKDKGNGDYQGAVEISQQNVKCVRFFVDYDDKLTGLFGFGAFKNIGKDTLTVTVSDMDENEIGSGTITGSGNTTVTIDGVTPMISTKSVESKTEDEANDMLEELYADNPMKVTYNVKVSLDVGEVRLLRCIWELIFKDEFTLEVTYDYYKYSVDEPEKEGGDGNPPTNLQPAPARLGSMVALGSSAKW